MPSSRYRSSPLVEMTQSSTNARTYKLCLLLAILILATFGRILSHHFVQWDDNLHIYDNPYVCYATWREIPDSWLHPAKMLAVEKLYIPVAYTTFLALSIAGRERKHFDAATGSLLVNSAFPFHLFSLIFHLTNSILAYLFIRRLIKNDWAAFFGAAIFALHPIQVESVAWASEIRGLMSTLFSLIEAHIFVSWRERGLSKSESGPPFLQLEAPDSGETPKLQMIRIVGIVLFSLLAVLSKPSVVTLPLVLLAVDLLMLKTPPRTALATAGLLLIPLLPIILSTHGLQSLPVVPLKFRPLIGADALWFYASKIAVPVSLAVCYGRTPEFVEARPWMALTILPLAVIAVAGWKLRTIRPEILTGVCAFFLLFLPVLGFVPFQYQFLSTVADRYAYFPMLGVGLAVSGVFRFFSHRTQLIVGSLVIAGLCALSYVQTGYWRSTEALMTHAVAVNPSFYSGYTNRGSARYNSGNFTAALSDFEIAQRIAPTDYIAGVGMGLALKALGRSDDALAALNTTLKMNGKNDSAYELIGTIYQNRQQPMLALKSFQQAVAINSQNFDAQLNLAKTLVDLRQAGAAIPHLQAALLLHTDSFTANKTLGEAYFDIDNPSASLPFFAKANGLHPDDLQVANEEALALLESNRFQDAIILLQKYIWMNPGSAQLYFTLGNVYSSADQLLEALESFKKSIELDPTKATVHTNYGVALAKSGQYAEAKSEFEAALKIRPGDPNALSDLQMLAKIEQKESMLQKHNP